MKVIELFAGIGSQTQALKNLDIEHEVIGISEIDKYAIKSYEAIHGPVNNFGDITKIEKLPYCDLLTYSFPCQSLSVVGKTQGYDRGSNTKSSLLWEVERLINNSEKPKYLLMENVKNIVSKKFKGNFLEFIKILEIFGYNSYYKILNAKDFGVPQNRERCFMISIRKDVDNDDFNFPLGVNNELKLKDYCDFDEACIIPKHILNSFYTKKGDFGKRFKTQSGEKYSMCLTTKSNWSVITNNFYAKDLKEYNINQIVENNIIAYANSPLMNFKLMGFSDDDFNKAKSAGISDSQLYKQAGNSIVVNVLEAIFKNLFTEMKDEKI